MRLGGTAQTFPHCSQVTVGRGLLRTARAHSHEQKRAPCLSCVGVTARSWPHLSQRMRVFSFALRHLAVQYFRVLANVGVVTYSRRQPTQRAICGWRNASLMQAIEQRRRPCAIMLGASIMVMPQISHTNATRDGRLFGIASTSL